MPAELSHDENYLENKMDAWNIVQSHATSQGIVTENPQDGGACAPFDQAAFAIAIAAKLGCYTCAINLAWLDFFW